tara:strand:- start:454 stop:834 length:381 start_codon:yes stop_codon:yes gene_type:complete
MKILITENKRYQLAYKLLDNKLNQLTRKDFDLNKDKDSVFSNHQVLFIDKDGDIVMRWTEKTGMLYISKNLVAPLRVFSFDDVEENRLIHWWFTDRVRLEPEEIHFVSPGSLDWENMNLGGLFDEF